MIAIFVKEKEELLKRLNLLENTEEEYKIKLEKILNDNQILIKQKEELMSEKNQFFEENQILKHNMENLQKSIHLFEIKV